MLSIEGAKSVAQDLLHHYFSLLVPHYSNYIVFRTMDLFASIVHDEIDLFFQGEQTKSSLSTPTEYGIAKMISDIYTSFVSPLYFSHFQHNYHSENGTTSNPPTTSKKKTVSINTDKNEEFLI